MQRTVVLLLLAAAACSGNTPIDPKPGPTPANVLTPAGGTVVLNNGTITVVAPAGAVSQNASLSMSIPSSGVPVDPSLVRASVYALSAGSVTLQRAVQVTVKYDPATGPAGVPELHYGLATVANGEWAQVSGATVDTTANTVSAEIASFGIVGVRRAAPAIGCTTPEHRQFDFWIGAWRVGTIDSDITSEPSACAIFELYHAPTPGRSISVFDPGTRKWYQTYVTGVGPPLVMSGGIENDKMVMYVFGATGQLFSRWTWEKRENGTVTQRADNTTDNGATWQAGFIGTYTRR